METENKEKEEEDISVSTDDQVSEHIDELENINEGTHKKLYIKIITAVLVVGIFSAFVFIWKGNVIKNGFETVKIVVSIPLSTSSGKDIINGITLALEEETYQAGDTVVELIALDDGDETGAWQVDLEKNNAEIAAGDAQVIAYIGPVNSGAAKVSMPILNEAGILQISPLTTWPGLTKEGFLPLEPDIFYPTGKRHFVRVVTTDDLQGPAGARWAKELEFNTVYIVDDGEAYGKGIADLFRAEAEELGMTIIHHKTIDKKSTDFTGEVADIKQLNPDLVYFGGITPNGITYLLSQMREAGIESALMGPDGILNSDFILQAGKDAEGTLVTAVGSLPLSVDTPESRKYYEAYVDRFGEEPAAFGLFGYEAAKVVLAGIEQANVKNRSDILQEILNTKNFEGLFGTWSFDERGDTTLKLMSGNMVKDGKFENVKTLPAF